MRSHPSRSTPRSTSSTVLLPLVIAAGACALPACSAREQAPAEGTASAKAPVVLALGAYTTPREAYGKAILPAFARHWKAKTGQEVRFKESYLGSGAQARAIAAGFEADVAALSLAPDLDTLKQAGLITHDYEADGHGGMVTRSIVVIGVRKGNPKGIRDWDDLAKPGVEVLTPDVRTSGGAMWNIAAIHGAALRGHTQAEKGDAAAATRLLAAVLGNVKILDKGARESLLNFERGVGDAIITYENELLLGRQKGQDYEYVVPKSTILIENPVAVVDDYVDGHGTRAAAEAFVAYLRTPEAQRAFTQYGLRPVLPELEQELAAKLPAVADLFTVRDLGGWAELERTVFEKGTVYDTALASALGAGR